MSLKLNISYPPHGSQKRIELDDEKKIRVFMDQTLSTEVAGDGLGDEFKGYVFKIAGGFDKQGFAMKQGVMLNTRTRLVLDGNSGLYRPRRNGCRRRKSIRGCITGPDLSVLNLIITKKGPQDLAGLTDPASNRPSMRGPKRAANIRKLWGLSKEEDVRQFVSKRKVAGKEGKKDRIKSPKIQRLVTPITLQRKRRRIALKKRRFEKNKEEKTEYRKVLNNIRKEKRAAILQKKRANKEAKEARAAAKAPATGTTQPEKLLKGVKGTTKTKSTEKTSTPTSQPKSTTGAPQKGKQQQPPASGQGQPKDKTKGAAGAGAGTGTAAGAQKGKAPAQSGQTQPKKDKPATTSTTSTGSQGKQKTQTAPAQAPAQAPAPAQTQSTTAPKSTAKGQQKKAPAKKQQ